MAQIFLAIRTALPKDFDPENAAKAIEAIQTARPLGVDQAERDLRQARLIAEAAAVAAQTAVVAHQKASKKGRAEPRSRQAKAAAWLLAHATKEARKHRKLKGNDGELRNECIDKTDATWREYYAAFRELPEEYRYKRGKPRKS